MAGKPCKGKPLPGRPYCLAHDPEAAERRAEGSRKGGESRANAKRVARQWAAIGDQMTAEDLPAILRACMISVKAGTLEPSQASAIAQLAKTSVSLSHDLELEQRIEALEAVAAVDHGTDRIRRIG